MPSNRVEKNKKHVFFVFVKFFRKMQFIFSLTNNSFDPDFDLDVTAKRPVLWVSLYKRHFYARFFC